MRGREGRGNANGNYVVRRGYAASQFPSAYKQSAGAWGKPGATKRLRPARQIAHKRARFLILWRGAGRDHRAPNGVKEGFQQQKCGNAREGQRRSQHQRDGYYSHFLVNALSILSRSRWIKRWRPRHRISNLLANSPLFYYLVFSIRYRRRHSLCVRVAYTVREIV